MHLASLTGVYIEGLYLFHAPYMSVIAGLILSRQGTPNICHFVDGIAIV